MPWEESDPLAYDPEEFEHIPKGPRPREQEAPTRFHDEWKNHQALIHILVKNAVPAENITEITTTLPMETVEDLATINARLFTLGEQFTIPRSYMLKEVERLSKRATFNRWMEDSHMSWLAKNADSVLGGPELSAPLPTKMQPNPGKPDDDSGMLGKPPGLGAGPSKPPMGGMPGGPGGGGGLEEAKMLLEKGDAEGALRALQKMLGKDTKPSQAPFLGKKPDAKPPMPPKGEPSGEPSALSKMESEPKEATGMDSYAQCGHCGILLEASCKRCDGPLKFETRVS